MKSEAAHIQSFSHRLIEAQGPVRILEAVRWTDEVRDGFLRGGGNELPAVDAGGGECGGT